jgi:hypothetical protein
MQWWITDRVTTKKLVVMSVGVRANELSKVVGSHCTQAGPSSPRYYTVYATWELHACHVQRINQSLPHQTSPRPSPIAPVPAPAPVPCLRNAAKASRCARSAPRSVPSPERTRAPRLVHRARSVLLCLLAFPPPPSQALHALL